MNQHPRLLLTKPCSLQQPDKSYAAGHIDIREKDVVWQPSQPSGAPQQTFLLADAGILQKAKGRPLLRIPLPVPLVVMFASEDDREAVCAAVAEAKSRAGSSQAAAAPQQLSAAQPARPLSTESNTTSASAPSQEERVKLLAQDNDLRSTHDALVGSGAVTEVEFWKSYFVHSGVAKHAAGAASQKKGVPNPMLSILELLPDGTEHKVQVTMTEAMRQQILDERPHIKRAHLSNVPHNMSEHEFWERFVRNYMAKHARRHKQTLRQGPRQDDEAELGAGIFTEDGAVDDEERARARRRRINPTLDLDADHWDAYNAGYGIGHNARRDEVEQATGYKGPSEELVREYNAHAHVVLHGTERSKAALTSSSTGATASTAAAAASSSKGVRSMGQGAGSAMGGLGLAQAEPQDEELRRVYKEEVGLEDLHDAPERHYAQLRISNPRLYFEGGQRSPTKQQQQQQQQQSTQPGLGTAAIDGHANGGKVLAAEALASVDPDNLEDHHMVPSIAHQVLLDDLGGMAFDGVDAQGRPMRSPSLVLPARMQTELRDHALVINELVRHFWGCIPVNTDARRDKFVRVQTALEQQYDALKSILDNSRQERVYVLQLVRPMMDQMDCTFVAAEEVKKAQQKKQKAGGAKQPA